jgi:L-rhamnose mutarotase
MKRKLVLSVLKPQCVEEYKKYHSKVWPELEQAYKEAGILKISCFINDSTLVVYSEYDENIYDRQVKQLAKNEIEQKWQKIMSSFSDASFKPLNFKEVYHTQ